LWGGGKDIEYGSYSASGVATVKVKLAEESNYGNKIKFRGLHRIKTDSTYWVSGAAIS